jgi:7-cyano-7-deazaguanine synthase
MANPSANALVLFSGGQDSTTCLAWALKEFRAVETIGFDYGQRHGVELECRKIVLAELRKTFPSWTDGLGMDHVIDLPSLKTISETALTRKVRIEARDNGLPNTFVPGRNILFLTFAAAIAYRRDIKHIVGGMCETDFSGYPDCRDDTIKATQLAVNLGMDARLAIHTPLMWLNKAETWEFGTRLGGEPFIDLIRSHTHTCYEGDRSKRHEWGYGCGLCPACTIRANGYQKFRETTPAPVNE